MADENEEVKKLQTQILNLEAELSKLRKTSDDSVAAQTKLKAIEVERDALKSERDALKATIWDKKERRGKERRAGSLDREPRKEKEDDYATGPFG